MGNRGTTGKACRYSQMLCYHIHVIVATLDVRAGVRRQKSSDGRPPPKWLRNILAAMDPEWLHHLLHDTTAWCNDVISTCSPKLGTENGTVIYDMWSPEDTSTLGQLM